MHGSVTWNNYYGYKVGCSLYGLEAVLCVLFFWIHELLTTFAELRDGNCFFLLSIPCCALSIYNSLLSVLPMFFCRCCPCCNWSFHYSCSASWTQSLKLTLPCVCVTQSHAVLCGSKTFPLDWSLKTRVRFVTSSSMSWCGLIRGFEESRGCEAFTACTPLATADQLQVTPATGNS